jgi:hypothetical protein
MMTTRRCLSAKASCLCAMTKQVSFGQQAAFAVKAYHCSHSLAPDPSGLPLRDATAVEPSACHVQNLRAQSGAFLILNRTLQIDLSSALDRS